MVKARKGASHCGGVPPQLPQLPAFHDTPLVADPGNFVYGRIVHRLMAEVDTQELRWVCPCGLAMLRCWRRNGR